MTLNLPLKVKKEEGGKKKGEEPYLLAYFLEGREGFERKRGVLYQEKKKAENGLALPSSQGEKRKKGGEARAGRISLCRCPEGRRKRRETGVIVYRPLRGGGRRRGREFQTGSCRSPFEGGRNLSS